MQVRIKAVALNHLDLWGFRGMAFAKRQLPLVVGAEAAGEIAGVGKGVTGFKPGDKVVMYGAMTCGKCPACREGRDNFCENVGGIMGFHIDGFARDLVNMPARLVIPVPDGVSLRDASCAPIAFGTVEHMLFDNAKLKPGETILVHAGGSGIGSVAIKMAKALGCTVITTVGDDAKAEKAKALGADHVINYKTERFEGVTRKLTAKKGVDVVFEHVGGEGFNGSLLCLKRGGRLVTCGSTAGPTVTINLMQLFQQQYKIFGSFGCVDTQYPRQPVQDRRRHDAGHRYRGCACRLREGLGAAGKPAGVRQSRRDVLMLRRLQRFLKRVGNAVLGALAVGLLKFLRLFDPDKLADFAGWTTRTFGPWLPENKIGRDNLAAAFPEKSAAEIDRILRGVWDNLGRMGAEFAHLDRLWDWDPAYPDRYGRIEISREQIDRYMKLANDGKPALVFAAHLANWELPAICAATYQLDSAVLYRRPNIPAIDRWLAKTRGANMGELINTGLDAPVKIAQALERGAHVGMLVDQYYVRGVEVTFFGRRTMANPLLARLARHFDCPIHGTRVDPATRPPSPPGAHRRDRARARRRGQDRHCRHHAGHHRRD